MAGTTTKAATKIERIVGDLKNSDVRRISSPAGRKPGWGILPCDLKSMTSNNTVETTFDAPLVLTER